VLKEVTEYKMAMFHQIMNIIKEIKITHPHPQTEILELKSKIAEKKFIRATQQLTRTNRRIREF
jgi:hypothetical protein